jgi:hypothetical protein
MPTEPSRIPISASDDAQNEPTAPAESAVNQVLHAPELPPRTCISSETAHTSLVALVPSEAPVPFSHVSAGFEDDGKKTASGGLEIIHDDNDGPPVPPEQVADLQLHSKATSHQTTTKITSSEAVQVNDNGLHLHSNSPLRNNVTQPPSINSMAASSTQSPPSTRTDGEYATYTSASFRTELTAEVRRSTVHDLIPATLVEEYDGVIEHNEPTHCWKRHRQSLLLLLIICGLGLVAVTIATVVSSKNNQGELEITTPSSPAPSSLPSTQTSFCDAYRVSSQEAVSRGCQEQDGYYCGTSVDMDGNDLVTGKFETGGEVQFFTYRNRGFEEVQTFNTNAFITSVAISGDVAVAGAGNEIDSGVVYIFERDASGTWILAMDI